jgi:hypothetical protein
MDMSRQRGQSHHGKAQDQGAFGNLSLRTAQIIAVVTTVIFFSGVSYGLNALFTALGQ